jgi:hypothetical protein
LAKFIVKRIKDGIPFDLKLNNLLSESLISCCDESYKLGSISIRENSYDIEPMVDLQNTKHDKI